MGAEDIGFDLPLASGKQVFSGRVQSIVYENTASGFYILRMTLDNNWDSYKPPTVKGAVPGLQIRPGSWFAFEGEWVQDPQYGRQIQIKRAPVFVNWDSTSARGVLSANGVPSALLSRVADHLGDNFAPVLIQATDPYSTQVLKDACPPDLCSDLEYETLLGVWVTATVQYQTVDFLQQAGVPKAALQRVWDTFGGETSKILAEDPWSLVRVEGISFAQADQVAVRMGRTESDPRRVTAAVLAASRSSRNSGHLFLTSKEVYSAVVALLGVTVEPRLVGQALKDLEGAGLIILDRSGTSGVAVYEPRAHYLESQSAQLLAERVQQARLSGERGEDFRHKLKRVGARTSDLVDQGASLHQVVDSALEEWSAGSGITLSDLQWSGAVKGLTEGVSVLTGLPGTGKTTSLRAVVRILKDAGMSVLLLAPTGIAAQRITAVTGVEALTIHRAFKAQVKRESATNTYVGVGAREANSLSSDEAGGWEVFPADVVIIDEFSMVDQHLMYRILRCTPPTARLMCIGDAAQLPSVGPGNVLRDLVACPHIPRTSLTEIYRYTNQIVPAAHAINSGLMPNLEAAPQEFGLLPAESDEEVLSLLCKLSAKLYERRVAFQIMSPRHQGVIGVTNLNAHLRELLNPKQPGLAEMKVGADTIRENDRVMVVQNNYQLGVFNGNTGKVSRIYQKTQEVEVKIHGPPSSLVKIPFKDVPELLRMAYAVTVHKMQGMETDIVLIPVMPSFGLQLQRNLIYTAVTRAKTRVVLVGRADALYKAVSNGTQDARNTRFLQRLCTAFESAPPAG